MDESWLGTYIFNNLTIGALLFIEQVKRLNCFKTGQMQCVVHVGIKCIVNELTEVSSKMPAHQSDT